MRPCAWYRRLRSEDRAAEILEAALVLPLVFTFLLGIIWFGRAFNVYSTITYAAREGAQVGVVGTGPSCATCNPTAPSANDVYTRVSQVLQASHIDPSQIQTYAPTPVPSLGACSGSASTNASNQVTLYSNVQLNAGSTGPPACGAVVSFEYPFTFLYLPFTTLNKQQIMLKAVAQIHGEN